MKNSHFGNQRKVCTKCAEMLNIKINMKKHNELCGKNDDSGTHQEKSKVVCKHWRRGRCDRGNQCNFSHVGRQDTQSPVSQSTKSTVKCRNGLKCSFLARGRCNFGHHTENKHKKEESRGPKREGWRAKKEFLTGLTLTAAWVLLWQK